MRMPVLFIGHGAPTNALADNAYTQALDRLGRDLPRPQAILSISAHWITDGTKVLSAEAPRTIHDFGGFPEELYKIRYPAPGAPEVARTIAERFGIPEDGSWGLDHGTWTVLRHLYPKADLPVLQVSLDASKTFQEHLELGKELGGLREEGILLLGSGNLTHNLGRIIWDREAPPEGWAVEFDGKAKGALEAGDREFLTSPEAYGEDLFRKAHPTADHYIPLLYGLGASGGKDKISYPHEGFEYGTLSMRMVRFG